MRTIPGDQLRERLHDILAMERLELLPAGKPISGFPGIWSPRRDAPGARVELAPNEHVLIDGTATSGIIDLDPVGPFMPPSSPVWLDGERKLAVLFYPDAGGSTVWIGAMSETSRQLTSFGGVTVYPHEDRWRIPVTFVPAGEDERLSSIHTTRSGDALHQMNRTGWFECTIDDKSCRFSIDAIPGASYVTFRDAGSGHESYAAGRVVYLPEDPSSVHELDLNTAQLQPCAYNPLFPCPLPPKSNIVTTVVRAGECNALFT